MATGPAPKSRPRRVWPIISDVPTVVATHVTCVEHMPEGDIVHFVQYEASGRVVCFVARVESSYVMRVAVDTRTQKHPY
jgi:hypothetical protein